MRSIEHSGRPVQRQADADHQRQLGCNEVMQEQPERERIESELNQYRIFFKLIKSEEGQFLLEFLRQTWYLRAQEMTTVIDHELSQIHKGRCQEISELLQLLEDSEAKCLDLEDELKELREEEQQEEDFGIPAE